MPIKLLNWNVAGRTQLLPRQMEAVERREPDIVALQEIRNSTVGPWRRALAAAGLTHALDSSEFSNSRRLFNLTAARWELWELHPLGAPQPERVLSTGIDRPGAPIPGTEERWDAAERSLLTGLSEWDMTDVFRALNGYDRRDVSWVFHTRARRKAAQRLDHVIASAELNPIACDYLHGWREAGLSDHSAMETIFDPD